MKAVMLEAATASGRGVQRGSAPAGPAFDMLTLALLSRNSASRERLAPEFRPFKSGPGRDQAFWRARRRGIDRPVPAVSQKSCRGHNYARLYCIQLPTHAS